MKSSPAKRRSGVRLKDIGRAQALIGAVACGASVEQAADKAGLPIEDVRRLMRSRKLRARVAVARADIVERTAAILTAAAFESVRTLVELAGPGHAEAVRLSAAKAIVELGAQTREKAEELARFAELDIEGAV